MPGAVEAEAKFSVPPDLRLPRRWYLEGLTIRPGQLKRLTTVYHDTPDLRLARWGASLRYRASEGWTVKLPTAGTEELLVRTEHRFPGRAGALPAAAVDLVRAFVRSAEVQPVATMRTRRTSLSLVGPDGREVAEVVDDRVSVDGPGVAMPAFREIEVELRDGAPAGLVASVARHLGDHEPIPRSKLVRALGPPAEAPPEVVPPRLSPEASAAEVIKSALASSVARLLVNDPGTRLGTDPESLHQCRVAVRRLRSDLRTFASLLEAEWTDALRAELRWLGGSLGPVRDRDVLLETLRDRALALPPTMRRPAERLLRNLRAEQQEHRRALLEDLSGGRYAALLDRVVEAANAPAVLPDAADVAGSVLLPVAARPWTRLKGFVDEMDADPRDEDLHQLRIRTKRARYAAEAVGVVGGRPVARFARAAATLQDVLGMHHDAVVAVDWLREAAARSSGGVAFTAGAVASTFWNDAARTRDEWPKAWKKLAKRAPEEWS